MIVLHEHGKVEVVTIIPHVGAVTDVFYPLCGDAVQTEVYEGDSEVRVRPDTYTRRAVFERYD